jgi:hypothetical protein
MKSMLTLALAVTAVAAYAQAPPNPALESEFTAQLSRTNSIASTPAKANEIFVGRSKLSGIGVQLFKTDKPLQLINPLAPPQYGSPQDNVLPDAFRGRANPAPDSFFGRVLRLKLLSIDF